MQIQELESWWASLPVAQKERIARKGISKASADGKATEEQYQYPACTAWWNALDVMRKQAIHDHCVDRHGYLQAEWNEANPYGD